jgi:uncharacterized protein YkwD
MPAHPGSTAAQPPALAILGDSANLAATGSPSTASVVPPAPVTRAGGRHAGRTPANAEPLPPLTRQPPTRQPPAGGTASTSGQPPSRSATQSGRPSRSTAPTTAAAPLPDPAQAAQSVFDAINASRRAAGVRPLTWSPQLQLSAHRHNLAMMQADSLSHQLPGEDSLGDRETAAGVRWWWAAENIASSGTLTAQSALGLESGMVNEKAPNDGHRQNILASNAEIVGVDVVFDTAHHTLWLTEDFAKTSLL